ncbi:MAG: hypothetical protein ABIS86_07360 [Streptosporangiaceae bacterium]
MNRRIAVLAAAVFVSTGLVTGTAQAASWHTLQTFSTFSACTTYKAMYDNIHGYPSKCTDSPQGVRFSAYY